MEPRNRERPDGPPGSVAERNDLARCVERQRPGLPNDFEIGALLDVRKEGFGALDLADHQGVLDPDDPGLPGPGQPDAVERVVRGFRSGAGGEGGGGVGGGWAGLGAGAVGVLMAVFFQSIFPGRRGVVKSALPMPVAFPPLSSVRSRATIHRIFGSFGNGSCGLEGRPMTFVSMPEAEMFLPISSTTSPSIGEKGSPAIQCGACLRTRRSPCSSSWALKASTTAVSS